MLTATQWGRVIEQHCRHPRDIGSRPLCQPLEFPGSGQHPKDACGLILGYPTEQGHSLPKAFPAPFCGLLCRATGWSMKTKMGSGGWGRDCQVIEKPVKTGLLSGLTLMGIMGSPWRSLR